MVTAVGLHYTVTGYLPSGRLPSPDTCPFENYYRGRLPPRKGYRGYYGYAYGLLGTRLKWQT